MQSFDILLLAMVAGFLLFRLYTVLGRRTGHERPREDLSHVPDSAAPSKDEAGQVPERAGARKGNAELPVAAPVARTLVDIKHADRTFDSAGFLSGARAAHELIVSAFARGDREALRPLVSPEIFSAFDAVIRAREEKKHRMELHSLALHSARITGAELKKRMAEITVTFESAVTTATYDEAGNVVDGDAKTPHAVTDMWTFARDMRSSDPNWTLVATTNG